MLRELAQSGGPVVTVVKPLAINAPKVPWAEAPVFVYEEKDVVPTNQAMPSDGAHFAIQRDWKLNVAGILNAERAELLQVCVFEQAYERASWLGLPKL